MRLVAESNRILNMNHNTQSQLERDDRPPPKSIGTATLPPESGKPPAERKLKSRSPWLFWLILVALAIGIYYLLT